MDHVTRAASGFRSSVFNTHRSLDSIFFPQLLIATGEYLSAHNWQASLRVLLKWCYTGPSTCNCVAAAQSWPLKGRAVIYLKWQQPCFYLPAEQKKGSQHCSISVLTAVTLWVDAFSVYLHVVLAVWGLPVVYCAQDRDLLTSFSQLSPRH